MNKDTRIKKIAEIMAREPHGREDIFWLSKLRSMLVHEIPVEYLIYNKYNGRILSRTKTLEKQGRNIDPEKKEGKKKIEELLWESKGERNKITMRDIADKGQLKTGIVTRDGIVIDGNRRLMLLNKLNKGKPLKYGHFKAVILDVVLEDEPIEIEKLETIYQMGEDEKLGYNPIEKYLKAKQIYDKLTPSHNHKGSVKKIAEWMGENNAEIEKYLAVVKLINDYLQYLRYEGIYVMADTPGDGKEDLFLYLNKWLNNFSGNESSKGFDGYEQMDVDDLKHICFDYIRAKIGKSSYDGKIFRHIADGKRENHFFGDKKIWKSFSEEHFATVSPAIEKIDIEYPIDSSSENLGASLSDRDSKFRNEVVTELRKNIDEHRTDLGYAKAKDEPLKLVDKARKAIESIDQKHRAFKEPEVIEQIEELIKNLMSMLKKKSPEHTLHLVADMLQDVDLESNDFDKESMLSKIKEISKTAYQIQKTIKKSR